MAKKIVTLNVGFKGFDPFAVYYEVSKDTAIVVAVLDMRSNPAWNHHRLDEREE